MCLFCDVSTRSIRNFHAFPIPVFFVAVVHGGSFKQNCKIEKERKGNHFDVELQHRFMARGLLGRPLVLFDLFIYVVD